MAVRSFPQDEKIKPSEVEPNPPCEPNEVNGFDRAAIGNNSGFARTATDIAVTASIVGPLIYDYFDVGWNSVLLEDTVVFAEVLAVNSALVVCSSPGAGSSSLGGRRFAGRALPITIA